MQHATERSAPVDQSSPDPWPAIRLIVCRTLPSASEFWSRSQISKAAAGGGGRLPGRAPRITQFLRLHSPTPSALLIAVWCRYDVKYGTAGFSSYGYQGGCAFATGSFAEAQASPQAAQYLCPETSTALRCQHDFSSSGICRSQLLPDDFLRIDGVRSHSPVWHAHPPSCERDPPPLQRAGFQHFVSYSVSRESAVCEYAVSDVRHCT